MECTVVGVLVTVITAIIVTITCPHTANALAIATEEFRGITCHVLGHTHAALID